ncbi:MAG TPA: hypothetical protein VLW51_02735 [Solirubrobacteraceae bacterium]|nr:hypothetical protein [Solirubrobacteraceae bacterium]
MLAYLFWHRPSSGQPVGSYEAALVAFHRRLRDVAVPGLVASGTARVRGVPWIDGDGYEDWYAVDDYAALGVLNDAAVDAAHAEAHDLVALAAGVGAGGLYALERGPIDTPAGYATWLTKPSGVGYPSFREQLAAHTAGERVTVWRRQMVLGPAPEFRVTAGRELDMPAAMAPVACRLSSLCSFPAEQVSGDDP